MIKINFIYFGSIHKVKPSGVHEAHRELFLEFPRTYKISQFATLRGYICWGYIGIDIILAA